MGQTSRESRYGNGAEMCCSSSQPAHIGPRQATHEAVMLRVGETKQIEVVLVFFLHFIFFVDRHKSREAPMFTGC